MRDSYMARQSSSGMIALIVSVGGIAASAVAVKLVSPTKLKVILVPDICFVGGTEKLVGSTEWNVLVKPKCSVTPKTILAKPIPNSPTSRHVTIRADAIRT